MKRRALLAAIAPLTAGCFGTTQGQSDEPTDTPEPADTPESTPTPEPTDTPDPGPSGSERRAGDDAIVEAQNQLQEAVYIYTDGVSADMLDVSAETTGFDARAVLLKLSDAQTVIGEAGRAATTTAQTETVESLREVHQYITQATDLQAWLIDGRDAVLNAYDAIDDRDNEDAIESEIDAIEEAVEDASGPFEAVSNVDSGTMEAIDAIGTDEYEEKQRQFEGELDALERLEGALSTIYAQHTQLEDARADISDGDYDSAENTADRASDELDDTVDDMEDLEGNLSSRADAFEDPVEDVLGMARDYENEAASIEDEAQAQ